MRSNMFTAAFKVIGSKLHPYTYILFLKLLGMLLKITVNSIAQMLSTDFYPGNTPKCPLI